MRVELLSIGDELVAGLSLDTNSAWLAQAVRRLGGTVIRHTTVGDRVGEIAGALQAARSRADIVVATGGLGPTADDLTREALAEALGCPLEERPEAMAQIEAFFARMGRALRDSNRRQALVPVGCDVIENPRGTAPGIHDRGPEVEIFLLPGVPAEMKEMFARSVEPVLLERSAGRVGCALSLRCFGMPESTLGDRLADLMARDRVPRVGTNASEGVISVRIVADGLAADEAAALVRADEAVVRERLGVAVFGAEEDTLATAVARELIARGCTVSTAESCTGGLIAKRLTDVPGSSAYFRCGYVTYANEMKESVLHVPRDLLIAHGAVSEPVARHLAEACRSQAGTDFALSATGIAGPGGGTPEKPVGLVFLGLATPDEVVVYRRQWSDTLTREEIRDRSAKAAMDLLRRCLLAGRPLLPSE
jgi:nicotinamide-nucleotide amidase